MIVIDNIMKKYGGKIILKNVCLQISSGDSIALTGHNGCGKSTLLRIMCGLTSYDAGAIHYRTSARFNYVPEHFPKMAVTPRQYIARVGAVEGVERRKLEERGDELFHLFHMEDMVDVPIKFLSKGTMQKVAVVQAMLTVPDILLLDEPLTGQDAESQQVFVRMVKEMNEKGVAIVTSCHDEWLVKALSKTVYEIRNKHLEPLNQIEENEA